jgi:recombinational DNA repair protein (RecF pathway)
MSYQTYITEALVCGTFNRNTADRSYLLFTKEAGMLFAEARSVREERSRQRFALQDFSLVRVSLIKGKTTWKVGSIESKTNYFATACTKEARGSVVNTLKFLRRFFSGQEAAPDLFEKVIAALALLSSEIANRDFLEKVFQVQVLLELGYVDGGVIPEGITSAGLESIASNYTPAVQVELETILEKAIAISHL